MPQMIFDVGDRRFPRKHMNRTGMAEAMSRIHLFELIFCEHFFQIFPANPVNPMTGKPFPALIDEQSVPA